MFGYFDIDWIIKFPFCVWSDLRIEIGISFTFIFIFTVHANSIFKSKYFVLSEVYISFKHNKRLAIIRFLNKKGLTNVSYHWTTTKSTRSNNYLFGSEKLIMLNFLCLLWSLRYNTLDWELCEIKFLWVYNILINFYVKLYLWLYTWLLNLNLNSIDFLFWFFIYCINQSWILNKEGYLLFI